MILLTSLPVSPVCLVTRTWLSILPATSSTSSTDLTTWTPPLKTVFEGAFTTAASVYLCLNYVLGEAHVPGCLCCFLSCGGGNALGVATPKRSKSCFA